MLLISMGTWLIGKGTVSDSKRRSRLAAVWHEALELVWFTISHSAGTRREALEGSHSLGFAGCCFFKLRIKCGYLGRCQPLIFGASEFGCPTCSELGAWLCVEEGSAPPGSISSGCPRPGARCCTFAADSSLAYQPWEAAWTPSYEITFAWEAPAMGSAAMAIKSQQEGSY